MAQLNLYEGNNTLDVELTGLHNRKTAAWINDADVKCRIYDVNDVLIPDNGNFLQPITLSYVGSSNGDYSGVISHDSAIVAGTKYKIVVVAVSGNNQGEWTFEAIAKTRPFV